MIVSSVACFASGPKLISDRTTHIGAAVYCNVAS